MDQGLIERVRVRGQLGFTLIEMMITVAVIAILALIVVPQFFKESRKTKSASEVTPMMAELAVREEQYKSDKGVYLAAAACPATTTAAGTAAAACITAGSPGSEWYQLRVNPVESMLRCSYEVVSGDTAGTTVAAFSFTSPGFNWFYVLATCDMDGDSAKDAQYFMSSVDSKVMKINEGF
jgi:prepilin-type N-terminal cleavage/methylation domain-containing protein